MIPGQFGRFMPIFTFMPIICMCLSATSRISAVDQIMTLRKKEFDIKRHHDQVKVELYVANSHLLMLLFTKDLTKIRYRKNHVATQFAAKRNAFFVKPRQLIIQLIPKKFAARANGPFSVREVCRSPLGTLPMRAELEGALGI